jgi:thermostable 8-oxoguanine DNA glycosylase
MKITWEIERSDISKVKKLLVNSDNEFVRERYEKNINRRKIRIDKDSILHAMILCLLTSQQKSGPDTKVSEFLSIKPFPVTASIISGRKSIHKFFYQILEEHNLTRFINNVSDYFSYNYIKLQKDDWDIIPLFKKELNGKHPMEAERKIADDLDDYFKGFGPKQSRNFLQNLGLTKYEIPIDSRIIKWLNDNGFPFLLNASLLQDKDYYHFVSDGIQMLCEKAEVYPCVLDAAIFTSFD